MWAAGNKAPHLCPKRCTPSSSSQLPRIMQEPWADACTELLTAGPPCTPCSRGWHKGRAQYLLMNTQISQSRRGNWGKARWETGAGGSSSLPMLLVSPVQGGMGSGRWAGRLRDSSCKTSRGHVSRVAGVPVPWKAQRAPGAGRSCLPALRCGHLQGGTGWSPSPEGPDR